MDLIKNKTISYLDCDKGGLHEGESLNLICLDKDCQQDKLLCSVCLQESYQKYQDNIIPLKKFLAIVTSKINAQPVSVYSADDLLEKMDQLLQGSLYQLKESVQKMSEQIRQIEIKLLSCQKEVKQKILNQVLMSENLPTVIDNLVNGEFVNVQQIQENCKSLMDGIQYNDKEINLQFDPNAVFKLFQTSQEEFKKDIQNYTQDFTDNFKKLEDILNPQKFQQGSVCSQFPDLTFNPQLSAKNITISNENKTATQTVETSKRYALSKQYLDQSGGEQYVVFEIKQMVGWVGIGLANEQIIEKKKFEFSNYTSVGHGAWLISSNNYTWNSSVIGENQKCTSFAFKSGDIIVMKYMPKQKQVQFYNYTTKDKKIKLTIENPDKNDSKSNFNSSDSDKNVKIVACVNLCKKQDSVTFKKWDNMYKF